MNNEMVWRFEKSFLFFSLFELFIPPTAEKRVTKNSNINLSHKFTKKKRFFCCCFFSISDEFYDNILHTYNNKSTLISILFVHCSKNGYRCYS